MLRQRKQSSMMEEYHQKSLWRVQLYTVVFSGDKVVITASVAVVHIIPHSTLYNSSFGTARVAVAIEDWSTQSKYAVADPEIRIARVSARRKSLDHAPFSQPSP